MSSVSPPFGHDGTITAPIVLPTRQRPGQPVVRYVPEPPGRQSPEASEPHVSHARAEPMPTAPMQSRSVLNQIELDANLLDDLLGVASFIADAGTTTSTRANIVEQAARMATVQARRRVG